MRRGHVLQLVLLSLAFGGIAAAAALAFKWLPTEASTQAHRIFQLIWIVTIISFVIFVIVVSVLVFAVLKFRAKPGEEEDGPPVHGSTKLEVIWTAIPTVIVVFIAVISAVILTQNGRAGRNPLRVTVVGEQFAWTFSYPGQSAAAYGELRLPLGRTVEFTLESRDVLHGFWVPDFAQKQDTVPGQIEHLVVTPTKLGTFPVICTQLCGLGHGIMRSQVTVLPAAEFDKWLASQKNASAAGTSGQATGSAGAQPAVGAKAGGGAQAAGTTAGAGGAAEIAAGKKVFATAGCMACHTLKDAGATGTVGPNLDVLKPPKARVVTQVENGGAAMPPFKGQLSPAQIDAVATYVSSVAGKG